MNLHTLLLFAVGLVETTYGIEFFWRDFDGTIPRDAAITEDGLLIGQTVQNNGLLPGAFYTNTSTLLTTARGQKIVVTDNRNIKILCTSQPWRFHWKYVHVDSLIGDKLIPLVIGGFEDGSTLYIGRMFHENQWKIGKVLSPSSVAAKGLLTAKGLSLWTDAGCCYVGNDFQILSYH